MSAPGAAPDASGRRTRAHPPPSPAPRRRRWLTVLMLAALACACALALLWQSLHTNAGTQWWLRRMETLLPALRVQGAEGPLLGDFSAADVEWRGGGARVRVRGLAWRDLRLERWQLVAPYVVLHAQGLRAQQIDVVPEGAVEPSGATSRAAPAEIVLPAGLRVDELAVDRLTLAGSPAPVESIRARVEAVDAVRIDELAARWSGIDVMGSASLGLRATLPASLTLSARAPDPAAAPVWARGLDFSLDAHGPLERMQAVARLRTNEQSLDARGELAPFEPVPLSQLDAVFERLDLAQLLAPFGAEAPTTRLNGSATLQLRPQQPLQVSARIQNDASGPWDRHRLPVRTLDVEAHGEGRDWTVDRAQAALESGTLQAQGRWTGSALSATLTLNDVALAALDARAPQLLLSGPLQLQQASPDAPLQMQAQWRGLLRAPVAKGKRAAPTTGTPLQAQFQGSTLKGFTRIERLTVKSGPAVLDARGSVRQPETGNARWDAKGELSLAHFDPLAWWPGAEAATRQRLAGELNGRADFDVSVPAASTGLAALMSSLRGRAHADFHDSRLAGQPLALKLDGDADGHGRIQLDAHALAADNRAQASLMLHGGGQEDSLSLQIDAPALQQLSPWLQLANAGSAQGSLKLQLDARGALLAPAKGARTLGPSAANLAVKGSVQASELRVASLQIQQLKGQWDATAPSAQAAVDAALQARFEARAVRIPGLEVSAATLVAQGTLGKHEARLDATLRQTRATPDGAPAPAALSLRAQLQGAWQRSGEAQSWHGQVRELALLPAASTAPRAREDAAGLPLLVAHDLSIDWSADPARSAIGLAPGQLEVLGAVLRWTELRWEQARDAASVAQVQAQIEPFAIATLLKRLQPDFAWSGDLRIGARLSLRTTPAVVAHLEVQRAGGDLQISELGSEQPLGLSEARFTLDVADGTWAFDERVVGSQLGVLEGRQRVRAQPQQLWPADDAPLDGALHVQAQKLESWSEWLPTGWHLGGGMEATLQLAGRFGAPSITGQLAGQDVAVRNALEGVSLTGGKVDLRFEGDTARIETLRFAAGSGTLALTGDARLGAQPLAQLKLVAEHAAVLARVDRRVVVTGTADLRLEPGRVAIDGRFIADEGLIDISRSDAPSLGDDVVVRRGESAGREAGARPTSGAQLNVAFDLGPKFKLRGRGIDTRLEGDIRITTPEGRLAAHGEIRAIGGSYQAYNQKLALERGVLTFVGDIANPRLDIVAVRPTSDTRVGVTVGGNVQQPRVRLFSDPELPDTEKLALLVTGRSYDSLSGSDSLILQRAALALLVGEGGGESLNVARALQLDDLSVRQSDTGTVKDTVVTLGKQISDRVYVGYERGLNATTGNWQLIYRVAQRFTLRAQSGDDNALDLIWVFRWN